MHRPTAAPSSIKAALIAVACIVSPISSDRAGAQTAHSVFGALPTTPLPNAPMTGMFNPRPLGGVLVGKAAPPTSAFARQGAPDVLALTSAETASLNAASRRSLSFLAGEAFVAVADNNLLPEAPPSARQRNVNPAQAEPAQAPATGCDAAATYATRTSIVLNNTKSVGVALPFVNAVVGDPTVAEVVPIGNRTLNIAGRKIGSTNVRLYDQQGCPFGVLDVTVKLDTGAMAAELQRGSERGIRVSEVNGNIVLSGNVSDGLAADRAMRVAAGMAPEGKNVVNNLSVASPQQVMLQVRFVEADRQAVRNLGVRWNAFWNNYRSGAAVGQNATTNTLYSNPAGAVTLAPRTIYGPGTANSTTVDNVIVPDAVAGAATGLVSTASPFATILANVVNSRAGSLDVALSALEESQVVRRLAEPNLVALSGESADFLAGGEFPVPVSSTTGVGGAPTVTIDYKQFGVRLKFTPTVLANGLVSLKLNSEVSDLDPTILVQTGGVAVPGISMRRANSTIELRDGQAFAIAGMLNSKSQRQLDAFPWLGTLPYLGALFSSKQFQNNETELVMLVAPHIVKPLPPNKKTKTPLDSRLPGNDIDMFLRQQLEVQKSQPTYVTPEGHAQTLDAGMAPGAPGIQEDPNRIYWPWEDTK